MEIISGLQSMLAERDVSSIAINLSLGIDDRAAAMYECPTPHTHKHTDAIAEIATWVGWLTDQGVERILLLGHSRGGNQVARYAATQLDPAVSEVVLLAPQTWDQENAAKEYLQRYKTPLQPILAQAQTLVASGKGAALLGPLGFIYCADTKASAEAFVSYYAADPDMDTPRLLPRIKVPVVVFAGTQDKAFAELTEKTEPLLDGDRLRLEVVDGAGHFFRDLYSEEIADALAERVAE
jgi:pimeloyl-ACP methyl ester carboxylesterase